MKTIRECINEDVFNIGSKSFLEENFTLDNYPNITYTIKLDDDGYILFGRSDKNQNFSTINVINQAQLYKINEFNDKYKGKGINVDFLQINMDLVKNLKPIKVPKIIDLENLKISVKNLIITAQTVSTFNLTNLNLDIHEKLLLVDSTSTNRGNFELSNIKFSHPVKKITKINNTITCEF